MATAPKNFKNGRENTIFSFAYLELFNIQKDKVLTGAVMVGYPKYSYKRLVDRNPLEVTWIK